MAEASTHREVRLPRMSLRHLADYMAASHITRRRIVRDCKYISLARAFQHDEAKLAVGAYLRTKTGNIGLLLGKAQELRDRLADNDFDRDLFDINADYIAHFANVADDLTLPDADRLPPGRNPVARINGIDVPMELHFRLRRINRRNRAKTGAGALRYAKGKALQAEVAAWQAAWLFGYMQEFEASPDGEPEGALCLVVDAQAGVAHRAPGDAIRRYNNMKAECESIAERWTNIKPPNGAVF